MLGVGWSNGVLQKWWYVGNIPGIKRLGIPPINMMDSAGGFRTYWTELVGTVTCWPSLLSLAATWDPEIVLQFATALGAEFAGKGANTILGPSINVHRVARNGRNFEYLSGEDPYLGSQLVRAYVQGVQGAGVMSVAKHFVLNSQETHRNSQSSVASDATLWQLYYPPFEAAVRAGTSGIMCSYNKVNGTSAASNMPLCLSYPPAWWLPEALLSPYAPQSTASAAWKLPVAAAPRLSWRLRWPLDPAGTFACGNPGSLARDLKGAMGFRGFVQSDWGATHETSVAAGLDQEMPMKPDCAPPQSPPPPAAAAPPPAAPASPAPAPLVPPATGCLETVESGRSWKRPDGGEPDRSLCHYFFSADELSKQRAAAIDEAATRVLTPLARLRLLNTSYCAPPCETSLRVNVTSRAHAALARAAAAASVVLLQNDGVLPLAPGTVKTIGVIGSAAHAPPYDPAGASQGQGGWHKGDYYSGGGSGHVTAGRVVTPLQGLVARARSAGMAVRNSTSDDVRLRRAPP